MFGQENHVSAPPADAVKECFWDPCSFYPIRTENSRKRRSSLLVSCRDLDPPVYYKWRNRVSHHVQSCWWQLIQPDGPKQSQWELPRDKDRIHAGADVAYQVLTAQAAENCSEISAFPLKWKLENVRMSLWKYPVISRLQMLEPILNSGQWLGSHPAELLPGS